MSKFTSNLVLNDIPKGRIELETLKQLCRSRLEALTKSEKISLCREENSLLWSSSILEYLKTNCLEFYHACVDKTTSAFAMRSRRFDKIARFVLLHALCINYNTKYVEWIVRNELRLFRIHFNNLSIKERTDFIVANKLAEKSLNDELYEVPWQSVVSLIKTRSVDVIRGIARIHIEYFDIVACSYQKKQLYSLLAKIRMLFSSVETDRRFYELISDLRNSLERCVNSTRINAHLDYYYEDVNLRNLDNLSGCFPPCMERIYHHIEKRHHLTYNGRLQYVAFLKDIGLPISDTLQYFRYNFLMNQSEDDYRKNKYEYFIRHQYGLIGSRIEYYTMNCNEIMEQSIEGFRDCHGCPLTTASIDSVFNLPSLKHLTRQDKQEIRTEFESGSASKICAQILEKKLSTKLDYAAIENPLQYYALYRKNTCKIENNELF